MRSSALFLSVAAGMVLLAPTTAVGEADCVRAAETGAGKLSLEDRIFGLVSLYSEARQHFAWWERVPDLDWDESFKEFLPRVSEDQDLLEYYLKLKEFIALLQDGHTEVFLPDSLDDCTDVFPFRLKYYEGQYVVTKTLETPELIKNPIPIGSVVVSIEGRPTESYLRREVFPYLACSTLYQKRMTNLWNLPTRSGTPLSFEIRSPQGRLEERDLAANGKAAAVEAILEFEETECGCKKISFVTGELEGGLAQVEYLSCDLSTLEKLRKEIERLATAPPAGVIFDLRGNGGGSLISSATAASFFLTEPIKTWSRSTPCMISTLDAQSSQDWPSSVPFPKRWLNDSIGMTTVASKVLPEGYRPGWITLANPPEETLQPYPASYTGPMVVLVDHGTMSAAEDLTVLLRGAGRAAVMGEITGGTSGFQSPVYLPGGGWARICDVQHFYPPVGDYIGTGIVPDIPVLRTLEGIAAGRDEILEAAIEYLNDYENAPKLDAPPNSTGLVGDLVRMLSEN